MGDLDKRAAVDIAASVGGGTVGPVVTALMAMAAAVTSSPDLAVLAIPAGAIADALTEQGIRKVADAIRFQRAAERVSRFAEAIADESGQPAEEFIAEHLTDSSQREFLGHVVDVAIDARSDWKIRILAHAYVRGIREGDRVDETEMFIDAIRHLEQSHARALSAAIQTMLRKNVAYVDSWALRSYDAAIGPAASLLWRDLKDQGFLTEVDTMGRRPEGDKKVRAETREGFVPTDLGYAIGDWLHKLDAEVIRRASE